MSRPSILFAGNTADYLKSIRSFGRLTGASAALAAAEFARKAKAPLLLLTTNPRDADQLESEVRFFAGDDFPVLHFVEWETLPWDSFSPHQDIVSQRLSVLSELPSIQRGIIIASAPVLLQRLPPTDYVGARSLQLSAGEALDRQQFMADLTSSGYLRVPQVSEHGEFAVRGSLLDVYPMGAALPLRIDFFDDEIETLREFDPESQLSGKNVASVSMLPAREIPLDEAAIKSFRDRYRERFEGKPSRSRVYRDVSDGIAHGGIEYFLPLFFESTASLIDYLPANIVVFTPAGHDQTLEQTWMEIEERYELCSLDPERPILSPVESFFEPSFIAEQTENLQLVAYSPHTVAEEDVNLNLATRMLPAIRIESRYEDAAAALGEFIRSFDGRILFAADSPGRREAVVDLLRSRNIAVVRVDGWQQFLRSEERIAVAIAPVEFGVVLWQANIAIISEQQLFGDRPRQRSRRRRRERDPETIIRQLNDLDEGSPVVHSEYGIGRYQGLITLETAGIESEFLTILYADGDILYVPVHALDLISRYTGASPENAPLHRLGSDQWAKRKSAPFKKCATLQRSCSMSMRGALHGPATSSAGPNPNTARSKVVSRSKRLRIRTER